MAPGCSDSPGVARVEWVRSPFRETPPSPVPVAEAIAPELNRVLMPSNHQDFSVVLTREMPPHLFRIIKRSSCEF
ncbi:MAG: hypothetical protein ACRC8Y_19910 [Chroococcales cyanobacterium]